MLFEGTQILDLIPQRAPMVMLDKFFGIENDCSYSALTVQPGNIFFSDGYLRESGIIEHIAQSAAARIGYLAKSRNEPVPLGFIGSIDHCTIYTLPRAGDEMRTAITVIQEIFSITLIQAVVRVNDRLLAECKMKIALG